jgi:hypothetical protein
MSLPLEQIFYVSQSVAALAVVASIIYLAQQVRQSERIQRAMVQQGRADRAAHRSMVMASPELAGIVQRGMSGSKELTREEFNQWTLICRSLFITVEDSFLQRKAGLLDDVAFHSFEAGTRTFFSAPGLRASWQLASAQYGKETKQFIDSMITQLPAARPTDAFSEWLRLLHAQETT